jgi:hypothetical protein
MSELTALFPDNPIESLAETKYVKGNTQYVQIDPLAAQWDSSAN